jgi:hypothetical protein
MKIVFDPDFDGGAWPGPLDGRGASAGEAWGKPVFGTFIHLPVGGIVVPVTRGD